MSDQAVPQTRKPQHTDRVVPDDFVRFVASYGPRITRACVEIAGHDQVAEALRDSLLVAVAGQWRRWPAASRSQRALVRLETLLQREAATQHVTVHPDALDLRSSLRLRTVEVTEPDEEAQLLAARVWPRATKARRMRWAVLGMAAVIALAAALLAPDAPPPEPTQIPEGVTVLPAFDELIRIEQQGLLTLPSHVFLDPDAVDRLPVLTAAPLQFAVLVAAASGERLVVAGFEHGINRREFLPPSRPLQRRIAHPALRGARLLTTSLSPDGTMVALPNGSDLILVDVRTGVVRGLDVRAAQPETPMVAWLDSRRLILPGLDGSIVVDTTTDEVHRLGLDPLDILTLRGYPDHRLARLIAVPDVSATGDSQPIRSTLELWQDTDSTGTVEPIAGAGEVAIRRVVTGPPWLHAWVGPGWASPRLIVRQCDPATLALPPDVGRAKTAIAAIGAQGGHIATLVAAGNDRIEALGYLSPQETLVGVRTNGRSLVVVWDPSAGTLATVIVINADASVSIADLLLPLGSLPVTTPEAHAQTPVGASPTMG